MKTIALFDVDGTLTAPRKVHIGPFADLFANVLSYLWPSDGVRILCLAESLRGHAGVYAGVTQGQFTVSIGKGPSV